MPIMQHSDYINKIASYSGEYIDCYVVGKKQQECVLKFASDDKTNLKKQFSYLTIHNLEQTTYDNTFEDLVNKYGNCISISPSGQFCLFFGYNKTLNSHYFTLYDWDKQDVFKSCKVDDSLAKVNVRNPFAGFSWNINTCTILFTAMDNYGTEEELYPWFSGTSSYHSSIYLYHYDTCIIERFNHVDSAYSYGQPVWIDDTHFYSIGWHELPFHESFDACNTLSSSLFVSSLSSSSSSLISTTFNPQYIRYNMYLNTLLLLGPDKSILVHHASMQLWSLDCKTNQLLLLVDHQHQPTLSGYCGLFITSVPIQPFITNGTYPF